MHHDAPTPLVNAVTLARVAAEATAEEGADRRTQRRPMPGRRRPSFQKKETSIEPDHRSTRARTPAIASTPTPGSARRRGGYFATVAAIFGLTNATGGPSMRIQLAALAFLAIVAVVAVLGRR